MSDGLISQKHTYGPIMQTQPLYQPPHDVFTVPAQCYDCAESCHFRTIFLLFSSKSAVKNFRLSAIISWQSSRK